MNPDLTEAVHARCVEIEPGSHPRAFGNRCVHSAGHVGIAHKDAFGEEWGDDDD